MIGYKVFLNGEEIDQVFYTFDDPEEVRRDLIDHDGYDPNITVKKVMKSLDALKTILNFVDHILMFQDIHDVQSGTVDEFLDMDAEQWEKVQKAYLVFEEDYNKKLEVE